MITKEQAVPGTAVFYGNRDTIIISGSYEDDELGLMIKSSLYPGGMPAANYTLANIIKAPKVIEAALPAITFELALIDEPTPVKITAALIREKVKPLTDLSIKNMFDDAGYSAVKKAVTKAVKLRTGIEKQEKEHLGKLKATYDTAKKEVTDYTAELYIACREAQTALEAKLTVIDVAKKAAQDKLDADELERTTGRDNKLFELGMTFNGQAFVGYGKAITKNSLYSLDADSFGGIVEEIEALQLEQGVTGEVKTFTGGMNTDSAPDTIPNSGYRMAPNVAGPITQPKRFDNQVYTCSAGDYTFLLTKGEVVAIDGQVRINERVMESGIYAQVIYNGRQ